MLLTFGAASKFFSIIIGYLPILIMYPLGKGFVNCEDKCSYNKYFEKSPASQSGQAGSISGDI
ncbi:hypothetical protein AMI01nite_25220 [Aneurinibacillus migulanus]|nr:hypothetical protein AMI01nite_25220 [Aneurinibacillus migulanus]